MQKWKTLTGEQGLKEEHCALGMRKQSEELAKHSREGEPTGM